MLKNILYKGSLAIALSAIATSCTGDFEEINTNPNTLLVGQLQPYSVFEPNLYTAAKTPWTNYTWFWNDELAQYTSFSGGTTREENRYKIGDSNWSSVWNQYCNRANNAQHMYELSVQHKVPATEAIALTLKVLFMSNLTDIFGDIPYKEAFKGRDTENPIENPRFESQKEVYEDMFADLEKANEIYATNPTFAKKELDLMYAGDMKKWQKFNNSIYLRLLMRVSGREEMNVGAKMTEILENSKKYPIIISNDENATVKWTGLNKYCSYFETTTKNDFTSSAYHIAQQVIKMTTVFAKMNGDGTSTRVFQYDDGTSDGVFRYEDPRLPIWAVASDFGWKGCIAGCNPADRGESNKNAAQLNFPVLARIDFPVTFMEFSEINFIAAEAAQRGLIPGGEAAAKQYYEEGIRASMHRWSPEGAFSERPTEITEEQINFYLAAKNDPLYADDLKVMGLDCGLGSWDSNDNKLQLIAEQKYLALFWVGMEAYHEIRRTGYPILRIGDGTDYNDYEYPQRFGYCNTTVANNRAQVEEALARMGGANDMKTPVWWSQKAITGKFNSVYSK